MYREDDHGEEGEEEKNDKEDQKGCSGAQKEESSESGSEEDDKEARNEIGKETGKEGCAKAQGSCQEAVGQSGPGANLDGDAGACSVMAASNGVGNGRWWRRHRHLAAFKKFLAKQPGATTLTSRRSHRFGPKFTALHCGRETNSLALVRARQRMIAVRGRTEN